MKVDARGETYFGVGAWSTALQLVHLYAERGSPQFEPAARRWLVRYLTEGTPSLRGRRQCHGESCGKPRARGGRAELATQNSALAQLVQKYQDAQGKPQPSSVPKHKSHESELPSEADSEKHKSDEGSDAPGSQNVLATTLLLLRGLLWDGCFHLTRVADPPMLNIIPSG